MQVFKQIGLLKNFLEKERHQDKSIGFIPTMGALHEGHLALIHKAKEENNLIVCSIFVNPTQFNNPHDLANYPQPLDADLEKLASVGCDVVFIPAIPEIYPVEVGLKISFGYLEETMEGKHRPGHFNGVALIVAKLLNIVHPDKAYFGLKDYQQYRIIKQLVQDLCFDVEIIGCPTIRENDGLAMSSRNLLLTQEQRQLAPKLYESLQMAAQLLYEGAAIEEVRQSIALFFVNTPHFQLEYFEIADPTTLRSLHQYKQGMTAILCVAAFIGEVRLIDNLLL